MTKRMLSISLGQGEGPVAEKMFIEAIEMGSWVFFQNCHLAPSWMPRLEFLIDNIDLDVTHRDFRIWLTSSPTPSFPASILQNGSKMIVEPPRGIKVLIYLNLYTLKLQVRHERKDLLEKLKDLPMLLSQKLPSQISLDVYASHSQALKNGKKMSGAIVPVGNFSLPVYIAPLPNDKLTIKAKCPMELRNFPMDRQSCPLILGSYAYPSHQLVYQWQSGASVSFEPGMTLSQFDLMGSPQRNLTFQRREGFSSESVLKSALSVEPFKNTSFNIQEIPNCTAISGEMILLPNIRKKVHINISQKMVS
ncbi:uncharacterized protein LOC142319839 [Lycorma delicatula]|uniref:uncharacterized protein LOC142319839 n=1 Tax=Lycorma delicatula TaxID=130591 RepID=UPI003F5188D9